MDIGIRTWGSHGDIRPFLASAKGLQEAGHEVHLVLTCVENDVYKNLVSKHGVTITVLGSPVLHPDQLQEAIRNAHAIRNR